jgi:hypothetical protein
MFKRLFSLKECRIHLSLSLLLTGLFVLGSPSAQAETEKVSVTHIPSVTESSLPVSNTSILTPPEIENDPLGSPYPIPWNWIQDTQAKFSSQGQSGLQYYRSPSLVSPDGKYAVYTRISLQVEQEIYQSRVTSIMFLENLQSGELTVIRAESPLAEHLWRKENGETTSGLISILMPVSWSEDGRRLLARQFEGIFSTSDASDYGVIWDRQTYQTQTISPNYENDDTSILLGWSALNPNQILFQSGSLGEEDWPVVSVALDGKTSLASRNEPVTYGQIATYAWTGSQVLR